MDNQVVISIIDTRHQGRIAIYYRLLLSCGQQGCSLKSLASQCGHPAAMFDSGASVRRHRACQSAQVVRKLLSGLLSCASDHSRITLHAHPTSLLGMKIQAVAKSVAQARDVPGRDARYG